MMKSIWFNSINNNSINNNLTYDNNYPVSINGEIVYFYHYFDHTNSININSSVGEFNIDDFEMGNGSEFQVQQILKTMINDPIIDPNLKIDAYILYGWLGSSDINIDNIYDLYPWAAKFIFNCFKSYPPNTLNMDSFTLMHYNNLFESLQNQIKN